MSVTAAGPQPVVRGARLIEGQVGPFYVAMNVATFLLCALTFFTASPLVIVFMRDAPEFWRYAVELSTAIEAGALAHIAAERILGWATAAAWAVHLAVAVAMFLPIMFFLH